MDIALGSYFSNQGISIALNIINFPEDYRNRSRLRSRALRYLFTHQNKKYPQIPSLKRLEMIGQEMFREFYEKNDIEQMVEITDIMLEFSDINFLEQIREIEEQKIPVPFTTTEPNHPQKKKKTVYEDRQNVHDSKINETAIFSIETLFKKYKNNFILYTIDERETTEEEKHKHKISILKDIESFLCLKYKDKETLINSFFYYIKTSTAIFGKKEKVDMIDIFISVWLWITEHKDKEELEKRLLEELKEMEGLCSSGHAIRLINVIQGFTEDENLNIKISNKDQCVSVVRRYLETQLKECKDEIIVSEMTTGGENYVKFIRECISKKILEWKKEYGDIIIPYIVSTINEFTQAKVFEEK